LLHEYESYRDLGKLGIPTKRRDHVLDRLIRTNTEWTKLKKLIKRRSERQIAKENNFSRQENFVLLQKNKISSVEELMTIPADLAFLIAQREADKVTNRKSVYIGPHVLAAVAQALRHCLTL